MVSLAIVTCGPLLEVALDSGSSTVPSMVRLAGVSRRSTLILAAVDLLFEDAAVQPSSLDRVVVSRGPGSFTGIRSGLATAAGLAAAVGANVVAYDSLLCQAARGAGEAAVWAAQPGRRGEIYAREYRLNRDALPAACTEIEILAVPEAATRGPWLAPETLDLAQAERAVAVRSAAEALLWLAARELSGDPLEPLYVEGPPINLPGADG